MHKLQENNMQVDIYPPEEQGYGEFDNGAIIEQKPIGFSGEGSRLNRSGTLFYWAWMKATRKGKIGMHPHSAFEIISYMISGRGRHVDSMGNDKIMETGGVQVMQTGRGIFHEEHTLDDSVEGFQIWLEPNHMETQHKTPVYRDYALDAFINSSMDERYEVKGIVGPDTPIDYLETDARITDLRFHESAHHEAILGSGHLLNILAVRGDARLRTNGNTHEFNQKDFVVASAEVEAAYKLQGDAGTHLLLIETLRDPGYRLYPKQP